MSRASPENKKINFTTHLRPSLVDALKKGVIDLHNYQQTEITEKRGVPFLIDTGITFVAKETGKKEPRIYLFVTFIKDQEKLDLIEKMLKGAIKTKDRWHIGKIQGAFWVITNQPKKVLNAWLKKSRVLLVFSAAIGLIIYASTHPNTMSLVAELLKYLLTKIS